MTTRHRIALFAAASLVTMVCGALFSGCTVNLLPHTEANRYGREEAGKPSAKPSALLRLVPPGGAIQLVDTNAAVPCPSWFNVTGETGIITNITVTLTGLTHTWGSDLDILLVGPGGQAVVLMSDCASWPLNNATLTFSDAAASLVPADHAVSGTYRPTDRTDDSMLGDPLTGGTSLSVFNGASPNGTWGLYIFDDGPADVGALAGWTLHVGQAPAFNIPVTTSFTNWARISFAETSPTNIPGNRVRMLYAMDLSSPWNPGPWATCLPENSRIVYVSATNKVVVTGPFICTTNLPFLLARGEVESP